MNDSLRIDRLLSLYCFAPLALLRSGTGSDAVPILMYHGISDEPEPGITPYYRTNTAPRIFRRQMAWLSDNGFRAVDLAEAVDSAGAGSGRRVVLTFDDGYADFYREAFPVLSQHGFGASVFLATAFVGRPRGLKGKVCLSWDQVRELREAGIRFGSHTVNHPQLRELRGQGVRDELRLSKHMIEEKLGEEVDSFAYPYAFPEGDSAFRSQLRRVLIECGYRWAVNTIIGTVRKGDDPYFLRRLPVNGCDDEKLFAAKLGGGYDWLHGPQRAYKTLKRVLGRRGSRPAGENAVNLSQTDG